jgi:hypothetical protein
MPSSAIVLDRAVSHLWSIVRRHRALRGTSWVRSPRGACLHLNRCRFRDTHQSLLRPSAGMARYGLVLWCHSACLHCLLRWSPCRRCCSTRCRGAPVTHGGGWRPVACVSWRADAARCAELRRGARAARGRHAEQPGRPAARGPGRGPPLAGRRGGRLQRAGPRRGWPHGRYAGAPPHAGSRRAGHRGRRCADGQGGAAASPRRRRERRCQGQGSPGCVGCLRACQGAPRAALQRVRRAPSPHLMGVE